MTNPMTHIATVYKEIQDYAILKDSAGKSSETMLIVRLVTSTRQQMQSMSVLLPEHYPLFWNRYMRVERPTIQPVSESLALAPAFAGQGERTRHPTRGYNPTLERADLIWDAMDAFDKANKVIYDAKGTDMFFQHIWVLSTVVVFHLHNKYFISTKSHCTTLVELLERRSHVEHDVTSTISHPLAMSIVSDILVWEAYCSYDISWKAGKACKNALTEFFRAWIEDLLHPLDDQSSSRTTAIKQGLACTVEKFYSGLTCPFDRLENVMIGLSGSDLTTLGRIMKIT